MTSLDVTFGQQADVACPAAVSTLTVQSSCKMATVVGYVTWISRCLISSHIVIVCLRFSNHVGQVGLRDGTVT